MPTPAGSSFFVPGVRVKHVGELQRTSDAGSDIADLALDIVSVKVTRVNHGTSQYEIVLNNWRDNAREETGGRSWPLHKYNALDRLFFGQRLRIDMRYWPDAVDGLSSTAASAQDWVPMIAGPITDMKFTFSVQEGSRLTISGEDDLRILKQKPSSSIPHRGQNEQAMIQASLTQCGFPLPLADPRIPLPAFFTQPADSLARAHEDSQTYYQYLEGIATDYDLEMFLEFQSLSDPASPIEFHLEPARSRIPPGQELRDVYRLEQASNLLDFTPTFKVLDQVSSVTVRGRHRERSRPERVEQTVPSSILDDELHTDPALDDPPLVPGPDVRQHYYSAYGPNEDRNNNTTNTDEQRARSKAESKLRRSAREFLTITGQTIGLPHLRAGVHIEIRKLRAPFDGFYYLTQTVHEFTSNGFTTTFTGRRPGMPLPPFPGDTGAATP